MADTETIIGQTKDGRLIVYFETAGPSSYSSGGFNVTITTLKAVEKILHLGNNGGYRTEPAEATISGNTIKIPVRYYGYACPGAPACVLGWEVEDGRDLSGRKFSGIVVGY